jgi:hypothetical protein
MAVHSDAHVRDRIADRNREHSVASDPHAEPALGAADHLLDSGREAQSDA